MKAIPHGAEELFASARFVVEATDFERHMLWEKWSLEAPPETRDRYARPRLAWASDGLGWSVALGALIARRLGSLSHLPLDDEAHARPVCMSVIGAAIGGARFAFWTPTSELFDGRLAEAWLKEHAPIAERFEDATNFHNCIEKLLG